MSASVSILIPCYNAARWLAETLTSALAQTWKNKEIIIVDDGSTDNSLDIARQFESSQVKIIHQPNQGASAARNRALQAAQGEWIQYLDADDLLSPLKIEQQIQVLQRSPSNLQGAQLAICGTVHFFDGTPPERGIYEDGLPFAVDSDRPVDWLIHLWGGYGAAGMVHPAAWLVPRALADVAGNWNPSLSLDDDGEYFARVVLASNGIRRSDGIVSYYRKYSDRSSLSGGRSERHLYSALQAIDLKARHLLCHTHSHEAKQALANRYQDLAMTAYPQWSAITHLALQRIESLGVCANLPSLGGWRMQFIQQLFGWKVARRASVGFRTAVEQSRNLLTPLKKLI